MNGFLFIITLGNVRKCYREVGFVSLLGVGWDRWIFIRPGTKRIERAGWPTPVWLVTRPPVMPGDFATALPGDVS